MLLRNRYLNRFYSKVHIGFPDFKNKKTVERRSLQAFLSAIWTQMRKRASCLASRRGSATVEMAMVFPLFLWAGCFFFLLGRMLMTEAVIQYTLSKTASVCAAQESERRAAKRKSEERERYLSPEAVFLSMAERTDISDFCVSGGKKGIHITGSFSESEECICISARYRLRLSVPFLGKNGISRSTNVKKRLFTGYVLHGGDERQTEQTVYVAENGRVYHTSLFCSHICLKITDKEAIRRLLSESGLRPCEKCTGRHDLPEVLYVTASGECYHVSLSCSGLKRTVKIVKKSDVSGMPVCKDCAGREKKGGG